MIDYLESPAEVAELSQEELDAFKVKLAATLPAPDMDPICGHASPTGIMQCLLPPDHKLAGWDRPGVRIHFGTSASGAVRRWKEWT